LPKKRFRKLANLQKKELPKSNFTCTIQPLFSCIFARRQTS